MKKRWTTAMNGHAVKGTQSITKRGADKWTRTGQKAGLPMTTERLNQCSRCGIHKCPGTCQD